VGTIRLVLGGVRPAFDAHAFRRVVINRVTRSADFADRLGEGFPLFQGHEHADLIRLRANVNGGFADGFLPIVRCESAPRPEGGLGCSHRGIEVGTGRLCHAADHTTIVRRSDLRTGAIAGRNRLVVDEKIEGVHEGRMQTLSAAPLSMSGKASLMRSSGSVWVMNLSAGNRPLCSNAKAAWKSLFFSE